jgi:hypothetical protein
MKQHYEYAMVVYMDNEYMRARMRRAKTWTLETLQAPGRVAASRQVGMPRQSGGPASNRHLEPKRSSRSSTGQPVWTIPKPTLPKLGLSGRTVVAGAVMVGFVLVAAGAFVIGSHRAGGAVFGSGAGNSGAVGLAGGAGNRAVADNSVSATANASKLVPIPTFFPKNLPAGYSYGNDAKALKPNILYYSVRGPKKQAFYITQQPLPANFDFAGFKKKFLNPDNFSTGIGDAMAGPAGSNLLGSIRTNKNTWIIINSSDITAQDPLEAVMRSLQ